MSIPHTGKLIATVNGDTCHFDGDRWITPKPHLTAALNDATESSPKTHYSIQEVAENVFHKVGLLKVSKIVSVKFDVWNNPIPDDAID